MPFWNRYPYTNFHELNLDWILKRINELMDKFSDDMSQAMEEFIQQHLGDFIAEAAYDQAEKLITLSDTDTPSLIGGEVEAFNIGDETSAKIYVKDKDAIHEAELNGAGDRKVTITAITDPNTADYGDNFLIRDDDKVYVIDFGNNASYFLSYLASEGITHIDAVIITHYHNDHLGGSSGFATLFGGTFDWSGTTFYLPHGGIDYSQFTPASDGTTYQTREQNFLNYIAAADALAVYPIEGQKITFSDRMQVEFHNIGAAFYNNYYNYFIDAYGDNTGKTNYNNFCMMAVFRILGKTAVFAGDLEYMGETLNSEELQGAYFLAVPHHGLTTLNADDFMSALNTAYAVVGSRGSQHYGNSVTERISGAGGQVYDTYNGTQIFTFTPGGVLNDDKPVLFGHADYYSGNVLPEGADMDDYILPGIYFCPSYTRKNTLISAPTFFATSSSFRMDVLDLKRTGNCVMQIIEIASAYAFNPEMYIRVRSDNNVWSDWYMMAGKRNFDASVTAIDGTLSNVSAWYYNNMLSFTCQFTATAAISAGSYIIKLDRIHPTPVTGRAHCTDLGSDGTVRWFNTIAPSATDYWTYIQTNQAIPSGTTVHITFTLACKIMTI